MFPPFSQESARHYCQKLISLIEKGDVKLKQCGRESLERKDQGVMIGSLVCWNQKEKSRVVLYAVSGNNKQLFTNKKSDINYIFVPSIVSSEEIDKALKENDKKIHELTDEINKLTLVNKDSVERNQLIEQRTLLTDASPKKVFSLYTFTRYNQKK